MNHQNYTVTTSSVYGGYDLVISSQEESATLFIQDSAQAEDIAQRIINIAIEQNIGINAAFSLFNQGSGMFSAEQAE